MRLLPYLTALPLAAAAGAQVYLYPPPPNADTHAAPTLSAEQAQAVMGHHLGADLSIHDTPQDEGLWAHLVNLWGGGRETRSRVVILEGADAQAVLPASLSSPSFYLADDAESALAPFREAAAEALDKVAEMPIVKQLLDTLDLASTRAGQMLSKELSALVALADSLWASSQEAWDAVLVRLGQAERGSELHDSATQGVAAGLKSMTQPNSPPLLVIVQDPQPNRIHLARGVPTISKNKKQPSNSTGIDYSAPLALILGTTVLLIITVLGSVALLYGIGEQTLPSTLNLSVGGRKHD